MKIELKETGDYVALIGLIVGTIGACLIAYYNI